MDSYLYDEDLPESEVEKRVNDIMEKFHEEMKFIKYPLEYDNVAVQKLFENVVREYPNTTFSTVKIVFLGKTTNRDIGCTDEADDPFRYSAWIIKEWKTCIYELYVNIPTKAEAKAKSIASNVEEILNNLLEKPRDVSEYKADIIEISKWAVRQARKNRVSFEFYSDLLSFQTELKAASFKQFSTQKFKVFIKPDGEEKDKMVIYCPDVNEQISFTEKIQVKYSVPYDIAKRIATRAKKIAGNGTYVITKSAIFAFDPLFDVLNSQGLENVHNLANPDGKLLGRTREEVLKELIAVLFSRELLDGSMEYKLEVWIPRNYKYTEA
jgi:hypothetical protein